MKKLSLNENFICRIWENVEYYSGLRTSDGREVIVLDFGSRNKDSGPDYFGAKILIDGKIQRGKIEIHQNSSDWIAHKHHRDKKYDDVVLNVALWDEGGVSTVVNSVGVIIPTVILSKFLLSSIHEIWKEIINNPSSGFKLPCFPDIANVSSQLKSDWITELSKRRLNKKVVKIKKRLDELNAVNRKEIWEQVLFEFICEALGYSKNKEQMLKLARSINFRDKKINSLTNAESLLFGMSGFLNEKECNDDYFLELKKNFQMYFQNDIYKPMKISDWNFFRLRPSNFPTVRIGYASGLLYKIKHEDVFKNVIGSFDSGNNIQEKLNRIFASVKYSDYWNRHYKFSKKKKRSTGLLGNDRIRDILINVLIPFSYHYSLVFEKPRIGENALDTYFKTPAKSSNEVCKKMELQTGVKVRTVSDEQGIIELHNEYCMKGKCPVCGIGKEVFGAGMVSEPLNIIIY